MFTNENSADAVYGSLDEARWSMECDENGNVLSIWLLDKEKSDKLCQIYATKKHPTARNL